MEDSAAPVVTVARPDNLRSAGALYLNYRDVPVIYRRPVGQSYPCAAATGEYVQSDLLKVSYVLGAIERSLHSVGWFHFLPNIQIVTHLLEKAANHVDFLLRGQFIITKLAGMASGQQIQEHATADYSDNGGYFGSILGRRIFSYSFLGDQQFVRGQIEGCRDGA